MKTAKLIKDNLKGFKGRAAVYEVSPPIDGQEMVVISAIKGAYDTGQPETRIFAATPEGEVKDWFHLTGSQRGTTSHTKVLSDLGYTLVI